MSNKKIKVKMNPLLNKSIVRDTESGIVFQNDWVETPVDIWERLKDNKYNQGGERIPVLIADDVIEEEPIDNSTESDEETVEEVVEDFFIAEEE
jgi:hypothetical protein|tara:strand:- start:125 stop:406 length:282 start_codon:yes stop_codon:yes gene_type:complete